MQRAARNGRRYIYIVRCRQILSFLSVSAGWMTAVDQTFAQSQVSFEAAAAKLQAATVTVTTAERDSQQAKSSSPAHRVMVCSGIAVTDGLIATYITRPDSDQIRVTMRDGERTDAQLRVIDEFTGLSLLEVNNELAAVEIAEETPKTGAWVISGAAWGKEDPVITHGIIAGVQRSLPQWQIPLLQCDLRTAKTSSGAGVVDLQGRLLGVVVATDTADQTGWTYAIPARHVQRLIGARKPDRVVVLNRRRPTVGLVLGAGDQQDQVIVQRVLENGPAQDVDIREGDELVSVDGRKIRFVYEALQPVLRKQPGDRIQLGMRRDGLEKTVEIKLGGQLATRYAKPRDVTPTNQIEVSRTGVNSFAVKDRSGIVRNLRFGPESDTFDVAPHSDQSIELVNRANKLYGELIVKMREELKQRDQQRARTRREIRELKAEIESLRKQLNQRD